MKVLNITTIGSTMDFFKALVKEQIYNGHVVDIATNESITPVAVCYREWGCKVYPLSCTRSPLNRGTLTAIREIRVLVKNNDYDIVHCHTPVAAICARLACRPLRKYGLKVIYTAHGFHFYKGAPLINWLLYYPAEKLCAHFTDALITINREDYALAQKKLKAKRIEYVPGVGVDTGKFRDAAVDRKEKRAELGIPEDAVLLMSVGELNENKNHQIVIRALGQLKDAKLHYAIAGKGKTRDALLKLAEELGVKEYVHLLGFRQDVAQLYKAADVCVLPSIREGLPVAALEGMATGLPLLAAKNRGTQDLAMWEDNAFLCCYDSVSDFAEAIRRLCEDPVLRQQMGNKNLAIVKDFDVEKINTRMKEIYRSVGNDV